MLPAWARLGPLSMRAVFQRLSYRRLIAKSLATARPTGRLGGFPTGRPWVFALRSCSRRPAERSHHMSEDTGLDRSFPDPFLGSHALGDSLPNRSGGAGSDASLVGGLSPRGRECVTGGDINPTCHWGLLEPISSRVALSLAADFRRARHSLLRTVFAVLEAGLRVRSLFLFRRSLCRGTLSPRSRVRHRRRH
jgi:hypothetical protein